MDEGRVRTEGGGRAQVRGGHDKWGGGHMALGRSSVCISYDCFCLYCIQWH
jgi:hypothetical protein